MPQKIVYSVQQIDQAVAQVREHIDRGAIVTLSGLLGAGKTAFVQQVCASFGVIEPVVSPTYAYLATYELAGVVIYHFDLYRISGIEEFESFGFSECLHDPRGVVLIEWPDRISSLLARPVYQERIIALDFKYVPNKPHLRELFVTLPVQFSGDDEAVFDEE
jgi:tRNA threonylcarbamoyladenosine biosynthesis protein TsaE